MKYLLPLFILLLIVGTAGCSEPLESSPDISRYTADQVIAVAKAYSPNIPSQSKLYGYTQLSWAADYLGEGYWVIHKWCIRPIDDHKILLERWYYSETSGAFTSP